MAYVPLGLMFQGGLQEMVDEAKSVLGPEVSHLAYRIREDDTGTPSIFFYVTLEDSAMANPAFSEITSRAIAALFDRVRPLENWGLRPYVNFRSVSGQQKRPDPNWV